MTSQNTQPLANHISQKMKRKISISTADSLAKGCKTTPVDSPGRVSPTSHDIGGQQYNLHTSNMFEGDETTVAWFAKVNESIIKVSKHFDCRFKAVIGLDCEWCPPWFRDNKPERINTIQLYSPFADCLVLSVSEWEKLPPLLLELLADDQIAKVGVNISGDGARLARDFDCPVHGLLNLEAGQGPRMTLEKLCRQHCPPEFHIDKDSTESKVRLGNWASWPLTPLQLKYASMDAVLSFAIFLFQQRGRWDERHSLALPRTKDFRLQSCLPCPPSERPQLQSAPSTGGQHSNFFLMHQNKSIVPPNLNKKEHPQGHAQALAGVVVVVSGVLDSMSRDVMAAYVLKHGGKVVKSVTKSTTHLVNDHGAVGPSKLATCTARGVPVVSEDVIFELVRVSSRKQGNVPSAAAAAAAAAAASTGEGAAESHGAVAAGAE